jgi:WD40 repeat protein
MKEISKIHLDGKPQTVKVVPNACSSSAWSIVTGLSNGVILKINQHPNNNHHEVDSNRLRTEIIGQHSQDKAITSIALSSDGSKILSTSKGQSIRFGPVTGEGAAAHEIVIDGNNCLPNSCAFLPQDEQKAIVAFRNGFVKLYSLEHGLVTWEKDYSNQHRANPVLQAIAVSENICATASTDRSAQLNDSRMSPILPAVVLMHPSWVYGIALQPQQGCIPDSTMLQLASACRDGFVRIWDCRFPNFPTHRFVGHDNAVTSCTFSDNGRLLASSSVDQSAIIWNVTGEGAVSAGRIQTDGGVADLSFSTDHQFLALAVYDGTIRLCDAAFDEREKALAFTDKMKLPLEIADRVTRFLW